MLRRVTKTKWLVMGNLGVLIFVVFLAIDYLGLGKSINWESWLGITMQGPNRSWFYFGVALLTGGPLGAIPFYVKRYCQKCCCRRCGQRHIEHF